MDIRGKLRGEDPGMTRRDKDSKAKRKREREREERERATKNKIEQNQRGEHLRVVGHVPRLINRHLSIAACRYAIRCISIRPARYLSTGAHIFSRLRRLADCLVVIKQANPFFRLRFFCGYNKKENINDRCKKRMYEYKIYILII